MFLGIVTLLGIVIAVALLTALAVSLIVRDKSHGTSGAMSSAALEVQSLLEPSKRAMLESRREAEEGEEEDASGEPP